MLRNLLTSLGLAALLCIAASVSRSQPVQIPLSDSIRITGQDANGLRNTLLIGYHEAGTAGFEWELGETAVPPVPFELAFDFRFLDPPGLKRVPNTGAYRDVRGHSTGRIDTFVVRYQPMNDGYPMKLEWTLNDASRFHALEMRSTDGSIIVGDMRSQNEAIIRERGTQMLYIIARH